MDKVSLSAIADFDELNRLVGYKISEPYEDYYEPMRISEKQKQQRIDLAKDLDDIFEELFIYMFMMMRDGYVSEYEDALIVAQEKYAEVIARHVDATAELIEHGRELILSVLNTLYRNSDNPWFYSSDRARAIAEGESNTIWNCTEWEEASRNKRYKTWNTIMDGRERESHAEVNGMTIPINDVFHLQGGDCYYPRSDELGMSDEEIVNCRCSLSFS